MTDTDTTIAGEVAAAVRILRDISETLRSIDTSPICHDPHDYGQPLNPREGAQEARGDTFTPDPPTREGDTVDAPQKPAQCAWPTVPGLYWVRGVDEGSPVEGLALTDGAGDLKSVPDVGRSWSICQSYAPDRLDSAVRVTPVPTEGVQALREAMANGDDLGALSIARDILSWLDQHEEARG
jgi:hypothetical protein